MALRLTSMENLFLEQLQELYNAEYQLISALPRLAEAACAESLRKRFLEHQRQAIEQVARLELMFAERGAKLRGRKSLGMAGILQEGFDLIEKQLSPELCDAGLLDISRKMEHHELASFGTLRGYARLLGCQDEVRYLQRTLRNNNRSARPWNESATAAGPAGLRG